MDFEPVIGLEVHAQLKTNTKIFCGCSTKFGAAPNTHVCPVCLGMPGVLPVLNKKVVDFALRMAVATNCAIATKSRFARKNYFYPDLPKGYQISQYELPLAVNGWIDIQTAGSTKNKKIGITRIHMEEDAGKLNHFHGRPVSLVDLNRTGVPLIEIVSEPDLRAPEEAGAYLRKLRSIVRYLGICDGNMEEGSFRCDANISLRRRGIKEFGIRAELKNLNSFKHVEKALAYEIRRQEAILEEGEEVVQETRLWNPDTNRTSSMRGKEDAHDYRYFPDPDLLPLVVDDEWIDSIRKNQPELPDTKRARFVEQYGLPQYDSEVLTSSREIADYFEECLSLQKKDANPKQTANWVMGPLLGLLNNLGITIQGSPISPENMAELMGLMDEGQISGKIAKTVFEEMAESGRPAEEIVKEKGLVQISGTDSIKTIVAGVLSKSPKEVEAYKNGKKKLMGFFVGQVMKETRGKANPKIVNEILVKLLK